MKKQLVIIGILAILITVGLSGCNEIINTVNPEKNKFVGTWKHNDTQMIFFSDGTTPNAFLGITGNWDIKDGKLVITVRGDSTVDFVYSYIFSDNDKTLTVVLEQPSFGFSTTPTTYTKQ